MKAKTKKPGTVIKVKGEAVTIQLSNNRKVTLAPNTLKLAIGDHFPDHLVQALERAMPDLEADCVKSIRLDEGPFRSIRLS